MKKGLAGLKQFREEQAERQAFKDRPKGDWLSKIFPKETGKAIEIQFLQEFDEDSEFATERGVGFIEVEHQAPGKDGFKRRAVCTRDDENGVSCYACEQNRSSNDDDERYAWRQRTNLYVWVLYDGKPYILSRNAASPFTDKIESELDDEGNLTQAVYRLSYVGEGTKALYDLKRLKKEFVDTSDIETPDLEEVTLRKIPYEEQAAYYGQVYTSVAAARVQGNDAPEPTADDDDDDKWS